MSANSLKQWRSNPQNQWCVCGRRAVACKFGEMVCARCNQPPVRKDHEGKFRQQSAHVGGQLIEEKYRIARGEEGPICGASLAILEARLKAA